MQTISEATTHGRLLMTETAWQFPEGFLWGAATSAHQVEGDNTHSDWWAWEQAGHVREASGAACDHYHRYEADFDLAKRLHHNAHRFSLEWSRIEPEPDQWNAEALAHYGAVIAALRARGIEPVVTLMHFTTPAWFSARGGWTHPDACARFLRYVERVIDALGTQIRLWVTLNEPLVNAYQGHVVGAWPPGDQNWSMLYPVCRQLVRAHAAAYRLIHARLDAQPTPPMVGLAKHMVIFAPCNPRSFRDVCSTWLRQYTFNQLAMRAFRRGSVMPRLWPWGPRRYLDFVGLNYYSRDFVIWKGWRGGKIFGELCTRAHEHGIRERNMLGWAVYPEGLYRCLHWLQRLRLPVLITENGMCTEDDAQRERFIQAHVEQVARALRDGVHVIGYLYWSLLDNFEWHEGFGPRFGLIAVDYATQTRTIRPSAERLATICHTGHLA